VLRQSSGLWLACGSVVRVQEPQPISEEELLSTWYKQIVSNMLRDL